MTLLEYVITRQKFASYLHGPIHWAHVQSNGLRLAQERRVNIQVVRLFALFHDSQRLTDGEDLAHGHRAAELSAELRGPWYELDDASFEKLQYAIAYHADGLLSAEPTIGTCWDADRLDLQRCGIRPDRRMMSTDAGRNECR